MGLFELLSGGVFSLLLGLGLFWFAARCCGLICEDIRADLLRVNELTARLRRVRDGR